MRILTKVDMLMLEMLANCNWERPLYMAISVGEVSKLKFDPVSYTHLDVYKRQQLYVLALFSLEFCRASK